jgi:hypothetical protein
LLCSRRKLFESRIQTRSVRKLLPQLSADENVPSAIFMLDLARVFREKRVAADRPQGASESNIKGKGVVKSANRRRSHRNKKAIS